MCALSEGCFFKNTDPHAQKIAIINKTIRENRVIRQIRKMPRLYYLIISFLIKPWYSD